MPPIHPYMHAYNLTGDLMDYAWKQMVGIQSI